MTFVISECAINFRDEREAAEMIKASADAGADAVKFQFYSPEQVDYHPRKNELICRCLTTSRVRFLAQQCDKTGIEFMATPMTVEAVRILAPCVKRWKIRYKDANNKEIGKAIKEESERQILVSCDGPNHTIFHSLKYNGYDVRLMSVVPEYPPKKVFVPEVFTVFQGFSSHYPDWNIPLLAAKRGAEVIEVHTMLDSYSGGYSPIDAAVSISMTDLGKLVKEIRRGK